MTGGLSRTLAGAMFSQIRDGTLVLTEHGEQRSWGEGPPTAYATVHSPLAWRALLRSSAGLADSYADGLWDSADLVALIRLAARNATLTDRWRERLLPLAWPVRAARALAAPSTRRRSRRHIEAHYDLGHELFSRMLDCTLTYSCALFEHPRMTLEEAQRAKLELICERLELARGDRVLEIGSGWGAFALHAASTRGCHITTTTISAHQHAYVRRLVADAGLADRVTVLSQDYRDLRGRYDKLVSIEMIEAVGWRHTGAFLGACSRLLERHGSMLLQAITIDDRAYEVEKASRSFIKERIFPGGSLPSLNTLADDLARRTDMQMTGLHDITANYVTTLRRWRERFERHEPELAALGYDERFRRMWQFYLAYCEAGFAERRICDVQMLLVKPGCRLASLSLGGDPGIAISRRGGRRPLPSLSATQAKELLG